MPAHHHYSGILSPLLTPSVLTNRTLHLNSNQHTDACVIATSGERRIAPALFCSIHLKIDDCHNYMATTPCYMINVTVQCKNTLRAKTNISIDARSFTQPINRATGLADSVKIDGKFRPHPYFAASNNFLAETSEVRSRKKLTRPAAFTREPKNCFRNVLFADCE